MLRNVFSIWCFLLLSCSAIAQTDSSEAEGSEQEEELVWLKGDMNEVHEYGIKLGAGFSTLLGGELENPTPTFGLNGTAYYRYRYSQKAAVQVEAGISLRGSNFNNGNNEYRAIKTYNIDVPVLWVRALNASKKAHLVLGAQYSHLLSASIFVEPKQVAESQRPKLKKNDVLLVAGSQFYTGFVGFQFLIKYGLVDVNDGLITGLNPALKNKDIHNFAFEINFLF
jgi:hypothetical protein